MKLFHPHGLVSVFHTWHQVLNPCFKAKQRNEHKTVTGQTSSSSLTVFSYQLFKKKKKNFLIRSFSCFSDPSGMFSHFLPEQDPPIVGVAAWYKSRWFGTLSIFQLFSAVENSSLGNNHKPASNHECGYYNLRVSVTL